MDTLLSASSSSQGGLVPAAYVSQLFIACPTTIAAGCRSKLSRPSEPPACCLRKTPDGEGIPDVLADGGVENVNAQVDALVRAGIVRRLLALAECSYSNSLIEAWWRSLKHQWLFLNALDSVATLRRLVAFYVDEHNRVIPHAAFRGLTPDEMHFGTAAPDASDLPPRLATARAARLLANRSVCCPVCPNSPGSGDQPGPA